MYKLVGLQIVMALVGALGGWWVADLRGAVSAALGGLACVLPTLLFVGLLQLSATTLDIVRVMSFFVGEAMKVALVVCLLCLAPRLYPGLEWKALLIGVVLTLQANFLVFRAKT